MSLCLLSLCLLSLCLLSLCLLSLCLLSLCLLSLCLLFVCLYVSCLCVTCLYVSMSLVSMSLLTKSLVCLSVCLLSLNVNVYVFVSILMLCILDSCRQECLGILYGLFKTKKKEKHIFLETNQSFRKIGYLFFIISEWISQNVEKAIFLFKKSTFRNYNKKTCRTTM